MLLVAAGFGCGFVNTLAGGGSLLTFPVLLWLGLPPQVANATNRIGIIVQCVASVTTFSRAGAFPWRDLGRFLVTGIGGSLAGAYAAAHLDERVFRPVVALLVLAAAAAVFVDSRKWSRARTEPTVVRPWHHAALLLMAIYGGFLQIGLGNALLAFLVLAAGYDLVRGNALKSGLVLLYQLVALAVFVREAQVDWARGSFLALGAAIGGVLGARVVLTKGAAWLRVVIVLSAVAGVVKLFWR